MLTGDRHTKDGVPEGNCRTIRGGWDGNYNSRKYFRCGGLTSHIEETHHISERKHSTGIVERIWQDIQKEESVQLVGKQYLWVWGFPAKHSQLFWVIPSPLPFSFKRERNKNAHNSWVVMVHTFDPSTWEAETGRYLCIPVWSTKQALRTAGVVTQKIYVSKNQNKTKNAHNKLKSNV